MAAAKTAKVRGALRLVLGDQLSSPERLSSLRDLDPAHDVVLMAEVTAELTYVRHHKQKIVHTLASMRRHAAELEEAGIAVRYVRADDTRNAGDLPGEVKRALSDQPFERVVMTRSGEWRLEQAFDALESELELPFERRDDDRFIASLGEFFDWSRGKSTLTMEFFYREMRKKTGLLMEGGKPVGERWNFDKENRKRLPADLAPPPRVLCGANETVDELKGWVEARFADNFGTLHDFTWATSAAEAEAIAAHFFTACLPTFGDYQDFMRKGDPWLWHARVSAALNIGFLDPLDLCRRA